MTKSKSKEPKAPAAKPKNKGGRPRFVPTRDQRNYVELAAGFGIPEEAICRLVVNERQRNPKPIDAKTLRKYFAVELADGQTKANIKVAGSLFKNATTATAVFPNGNPTCQIFWLKARMQWKDRHDRPPAPGALPPEEEGMVDENNRYEIARRIALALRRGLTTADKPALVKQAKPGYDGAKLKVATEAP